MKVLVTGSSGHLGEALVRTLKPAGHEVVGIDIVASPFTDVMASITDRRRVRDCMQGVDAVLHTATLHKPHVATHGRQSFVDTNITGTLNLLEEAVAAGVAAFIFTSTTSVFGDALAPPAGSPAAWITEEVTPIPKNIYGATKAAAEDLCQLFHRNHALACLILRTSRFFPEQDDNDARRAAFDDTNLKVNEFLYRRVDIEDAVSAHVKAIEGARAIGFGKFIISATSPFMPADLAQLRTNGTAAARARIPGFDSVYSALGWRMLADIDRIYVNERARTVLGWTPRYDFARLLEQLGAGQGPGSALARAVGSKGYHAESRIRERHPVESLSGSTDAHGSQSGAGSSSTG